MPDRMQQDLDCRCQACGRHDLTLGLFLRAHLARLGHGCHAPDRLDHRPCLSCFTALLRIFMTRIAEPIQLTDADGAASAQYRYRARLRMTCEYCLRQSLSKSVCACPYITARITSHVLKHLTPLLVNIAPCSTKFQASTGYLNCESRTNAC